MQQADIVEMLYRAAKQGTLHDSSSITFQGKPQVRALFESLVKKTVQAGPWCHTQFGSFTQVSVQQGSYRIKSFWLNGSTHSGDENIQYNDWLRTGRMHHACTRLGCAGGEHQKTVVVQQSALSYHVDPMRRRKMGMVVSMGPFICTACLSGFHATILGKKFACCRRWTQLVWTVRYGSWSRPTMSPKDSLPGTNNYPMQCQCRLLLYFRVSEGL